MKKKLQLLVIITSLLLCLNPTNAQVPVLGTTASFVLFTSSGAVTNTGISQVTGNIGTNTTGGAITGFGNVNGVLHIGDATTLQASNDLTLLYAGLNTAPFTATHAPLLGNGETLNAGVYAIAGVTTLSNVLTLDGQNNPNAIFIFQISAPFSSNASSEVKLINGALACNVFWKVEGAVNLASLTIMRGTIVANNDAIDLGAGITLEGRALSTTGAITQNGVLAYLPTGCGSVVLTGPAAPVLGVAGCYALFTGNENNTNAGISYVTGDVGTNVGITGGYDPLLVNGTIHPIPDISTAAAASSLINVVTYLNALPHDIQLLYPAQFGHNLVLTPHTYLMDAAAALTDSVFLNAAGNANAVFVIKINGALTTSTFSKVILINGAQAKNVYWIVNGAVTISDYSIFNGTIVSNNGAVSLTTGVTLYGRALTTNGLFSTSAVRVSGPLADCITIPLKWLTFTAEKNSRNIVLLKWSTTNELNNDHFDIERSSNGTDFTLLGTVSSRNSAGDNNYTYNDPKVINGINFYRVKQVDRDGHFTYSTIQRITVNADSWFVFPNPAVKETFIHIRSQLNNLYVVLLDTKGNAVYRRSWKMVGAGQLIGISLSGFARGTYLLKINSDTESRTETVILQ
ncbi:MAG: ice-binding family protein [Ferruginibacter sp.]